MKLDLKHLPPINSVGIEERVARFTARSIKQETKIDGLKLALSMIDLTTLEGKDTTEKVKQLCYKAMHPADDLFGLPNVAAICVYPNHVKTAKRALQGSHVKVASVATAFPSGNSTLKVKLEDTRFSLSEGADEIDMVISRGEFLSGNYSFVFDEIAAIKGVCGQHLLKVILETGELGSLDNVRKASEIAMHAGANFIKTSTGKIQPAATMPVTLVMLEAIKDFYHKTNRMIGMKPAGGISTSKVALQYLVMLNETLGGQWMSPEYFRFGASSLANDIILQLGKEQHGVYYNKDHVSND
jgi:deoxyribose-phosphate aldolase